MPGQLSVEQNNEMAKTTELVSFNNDLQLSEEVKQKLLALQQKCKNHHIIAHSIDLRFQEKRAFLRRVLA